MNERNVSERIVLGWTRACQAWTGDPWMAQHVLARAEEELLNRRKRAAAPGSWGPAVLALAGMGALAVASVAEQAASMKQGRADRGRPRGLGRG